MTLKLGQLTLTEHPYRISRGGAGRYQGQRGGGLRVTLRHDVMANLHLHTAGKAPVELAIGLSRRCICATTGLTETRAGGILQPADDEWQNCTPIVTAEIFCTTTGKIRWNGDSIAHRASVPN